MFNDQKTIVLMMLLDGMGISKRQEIREPLQRRAVVVLTVK